MLRYWIVIALAAGAWGCGPIIQEHDVTYKESGILVVGTPGDYAPFALCKWRPRTGKHTCQGHDIDLMKAFAKARGYKLSWHRMGWKDLTDRDAVGRTRIAVGGFTMTDARRRYGTFSTPLLRSGKLALLRCDDREKYSSVDAMATARIATNPGGTNEAFARDTFSAEQVVVIHDNLAIPGALEKSRVDVFFTDAPEARFVVSERPQLCIGLGGKRFAPFELGVWFSRGHEELVRSFNEFLASAKGRRIRAKLARDYGLEL